jgi:uracil-DNA glycosylase
MLVGSLRTKKGAIIDDTKHLVLKAAHPSPFAADKGFFRNAPLSAKPTPILKKHGKKEIDW